MDIYIYIYIHTEREREREDLESRRINRALLEKKILKINGEKLISRKFFKRWSPVTFAASEYSLLATNFS